MRHLSFFYGETQALKSISFPLYRNEVTAFIGPSGCGKSTLLRVLNRMYDLYPNQRAEGKVLLDGENILSPDQDGHDDNGERQRAGDAGEMAHPHDDNLVHEQSDDDRWRAQQNIVDEAHEEGEL